MSRVVNKLNTVVKSREESSIDNEAFPLRTFQLEKHKKGKLVVQFARVVDLFNEAKIVELLQAIEPRDNLVGDGIGDVLAFDDFVGFSKVSGEEEEREEDTGGENPASNGDVDGGLYV